MIFETQLLNMSVLIFSTTFVRNISHSKNKLCEYDKKCILVFMYKVPIIVVSFE